MFVLYLLKSRIESEREREKEKWEVAFMCVWGGDSEQGDQIRRFSKVLDDKISDQSKPHY